MKYFIVTMYRYGDTEKHSYVLGVFSSVQNAIRFGDDEHKYRGGKYEWHLVEAELDRPLPAIESEKE